MRKRILIVATTTLLTCFSCLAAKAQTRAIANEERVPTYEIGGQIFAFGSKDLGYGWGAGNRFTYNLNNNVALESEVDFFLPDEGPPTAVQGLFGVKAGKRIDKVGIFAKVRPGFQTNFRVNNRDQAAFALDIGVVSEYAPNRHFVLRFDAGDVIIPFGSGLVGYGTSVQQLGTTHNFQYSLGVGVRF